MVEIFTPTNGNYDEQMREDFKTTKNSVVGWLLMASYAYYVLESEKSLLSDEVFDKACKWLYDNWDSVKHRLKGMIDKEGLKAGTMYYLSYHEYPQGLRDLTMEAVKKL